MGEVIELTQEIEFINKKTGDALILPVGVAKSLIKSADLWKEILKEGKALVAPKAWEAMVITTYVGEEEDNGASSGTKPIIPGGLRPPE